MKTALLMAKTQLLRVTRDPVTLIVLFAIPILLLVMFGAFMSNTDNISLRVAVVNNSSEKFAKDFSKQLEGVKVFKQPEKQLSLDEAKQKMRDDELDGIVELPSGFGKIDKNVPSGKAKVYFDQTDATTGDIVSSVMNSVIEASNKQITGANLPLSVERESIAGSGGRFFDSIFAMFTAMAIMMVGIFGAASAIPYDKKSGVLRRLRVTPLKTRDFVFGMMTTYLIVGMTAVILMTSLAVLLFNLEMKGSWLDLGIFTFLATILMVGFGLAVGGWAKNSTQADIYGQIIFLTSMAFSGLWFPRALMPDWLQSITSFLPLTSIIDGIRSIVTEGASIMSLGSELMIIAVWAVVITIIGIKTFRWE